ncbi:MAG: two-component regulator propeller domain-containing protein, partial [Candidatus Poribacteria bacterium]
MKEKRKLPKILEFDEEQRLLDWTHQNRSFRDYVVILTILRTGLRADELRGLLISNISADGEILTHLKVRTEIAHDKKTREMPIPNDLREQFLAFLEWKQQRGEPIDSMSFLFVSAKSPQLTVRHLQRIVRELTVRALGKPYRVQDLRRTWQARPLTEPDRKDAETTFSDAARPESAQNTKSKNNADSTPGEVEIVQLKQSTWQTYDATDGLPGGVWCLLQDQHGYLWLGTSVEKDTGTGLCRYDGASFITYTTDDGLADNHVMSIYEDHQGRLWLGTPKGISCFDGQRFTNYTTEDGLADNYVCAICEDRQGRLWIGTREGGVSCFDGQRFTNYTTENGLPYNGVKAICEDRQGTLWFGTGGGICRFDGRRFTTYTTADGLASDYVVSIC